MGKERLLLILVLFLIALPLVSAVNVSDCTDLQNIRDDVTASYILVNDIDCTGVAFKGIANDSVKFSGTLDGDGYVVDGLNITTATNTDGMFRYTNGAVIKNLGLTNVNLTSSSDQLGTFVGNADGGTLIDQCYVTGGVKGNTNTGGVVGLLMSATDTINNTYTRATLTTPNGGHLVGAMVNGIVENSYATGPTNDADSALGYYMAAGTSTNNHWDNETTGATSSVIPPTKGMNTADMKTEAKYTNWDFTNIWDIDGVTNDGYPFLRVFASPPPPTPDIITINIISPDNNTYSNSNLPNITFTAIGNDSTVNCDIFFSNTPYGNNASVLNNTNTIIPLNASLSEGTRSYYINCSDGSVTNVSEIRRIIIDTIDPAIALITPLDNYITNNQSLEFLFNVSDGNINTCSIYINGTLNQTKNIVVDGYYTYQENATEIICSADGTWGAGEKCSNTYDNNWITWGGSVISEYATVYLNYTKILNSTLNTLWQIKSGNNSGGSENESINLTIPSSCWNYDPDKLVLKAVSLKAGASSVEWYCHNNTGWQSLKRYSKEGDTPRQIYEEAVWWHIRNSSIATDNFNISNFARGSYNWDISCSDMAGNSNSSGVRSFFIDITDPTIDSYSPANNTILSWNENVTFDLLTSDNNFIYLIQSNITDPSDTIVYDLNYTDTGGAEESSIRLNGSIKLNTNGTYTWTKTVCDGHTAEDIKDKVKDPSIDLATKKIDFKDFRFLPKDPSNIEKGKTEKLKDRYTFGWDLKEIKKTQFDLISDYKLDYFPKSQQFIIGEKRIWIDFVGLESLKITKVSDYYYIIETTPKTKEIKARSVGALNCIHETSYFDINTMGLNLTAKEYSSNATINTFTATILNLSWTKNTTVGYIEFNLSAGNYTIEINASGYARKNETIEILGHENLTSYLYGANSVLTNIYDQDTGVLINNASVLFDANTTYYQTHETTNGSVYVTGLPTSSYDIIVSSTDYVNSYYQISLTGSNHITLNAYLLNTSNLVVITIKSDETDKFIEGASVILTRKVNGSWVSVGSQTTDGVGAVRFGMKEGEEYKLQISASGYNTKEITLKPYENSYTIYLVRDTAQTFYDLFNKMSYRIMPYMLVIPPYSYNNPISCFNLTTSSSGGYIDFFGLNGSLNGSAMNISNITGSPNGATAEFCLNLTNFNNYNITIDYWIKVNGEDLWENQRQYFITNLTEGSLTEWFSVKNYSMTGWLQTYGAEIPTTWKVIIMVAVAVGLMLTFAWWLPPMVTGFIGVAVIGVMSFMWFPEYIIISMILIMIMAIMYLVMRGKE